MASQHLGFRQHLTSKITAFDSPSYFQDTMIEGAFKFMQHDHFFLALSETSTEMRDRFTFEAPLPAFGFIAERLFLRRYMDRLLSRRNEILKQRVGQVATLPTENVTTERVRASYRDGDFTGR